MSVLDTVTELLRASTQSPNRGEGTERESEGAYWCDDCGERIRDVELENESEPPSCPACGEEMRFERAATTTGCAC